MCMIFIFVINKIRYLRSHKLLGGCRWLRCTRKMTQSLRDPTKTLTPNAL